MYLVLGMRSEGPVKISMRVDNTALFRRLGPKADRALAYGVVNALNKTAKEVQQAERERVLSEFDVRQKAFISREAAKIERENFANVRKGQAWVEIGVGQKPRLLLSEFEKGGTRYPFVGEHVAMPVIGSPARRTRKAKVPKQFTFEQLNFQKGRNRTYTGANRTYLIPEVGVFQRGAKRKRKAERHDSVMLYAFVKPFQLKPRLAWVRTARRTAQSSFRRHLEDEARQAIIHRGLA